MPSITPITAERIAAMPTSAIVRSALLRISLATGWLVEYERPKFSVAVCLR
jgi:hypothetical protein